MCMRPCGPVRRSSGSGSTKSVVNVEYWTNMGVCSGAEVGGKTTVALNKKEMSALQEAIAKGGNSSEKLKKLAPAVAAKVGEKCREDMFRQMALDVYDDYDFSDPHFRGMRKEAKIRHIMSEADTKDITIRYEVNVNK